ncbi:uncharacterized protein LAESUDRAFT_759227 [Laetiporus sulphureus 93-53]|uniref:Uncharacterized protein n=1 Tax=Laetiporus sulphureus 93-53 TaxID=1314785 RepID=A0A165ECN1_9APHY|nr:uncharacterized protein LAESUDRAFT_759227 [Laetiporus sulphureus 93-53]KZT06738.1 hypothetical protein LAESUDRAFT_759227 [Laetiporus sulphureus 93-53]
MAYYGNDQLDSSHTLCQPNLLAGCSRCIIRNSSICCFLCSPDHFTSQTSHSELVILAATRISIIRKDNVMTDQAHNLITALDEFRRKHMKEKFGDAVLKNMGPRVVMRMPFSSGW